MEKAISKNTTLNKLLNEIRGELISSMTLHRNAIINSNSSEELSVINKKLQQLQLTYELLYSHIICMYEE
ncbi:hypothetical protein GNP44_09480 [Aliivibrio fischeri]|uniref:hypothetical protein n=1 Tax=Aliivibrio fischeri TaxID=668 RepID=UPI0012D8FA6D|nr:hypothetical protein [Aliivibrio fischeri]MUK30312.1 hypothetical protein [Aliivibrio fischeri]